MRASPNANDRSAAGRRAGLVLMAAGLLTLIGSGNAWAACSTTGCDGFLQAFSEQSGIEFGHGIVTGIAGGLLALTGIPVHRRGGGRRSRTAAVLLSLVVLATVVALVIGVYTLNDDRLHLWGIPAPGTFLTGAGGILGFGAGWRLRPTVPAAD